MSVDFEMRSPADCGETVFRKITRGGIAVCRRGAAGAATLLVLPSLCMAQESTLSPTPVPWFVYTVVIGVLVAAIIAILLIRAAVYATNWSLADALSEETEITAVRTNAAGQEEPVIEAGKPVLVTVMRASSSRLIALMGMIALLLMFLGFGSFTLYHFAATGEMPSGTDKMIDFLVAGMTLFAPYFVNKFSSLFEGLSPKKT